MSNEKREMAHTDGHMDCSACYLRALARKEDFTGIWSFRAVTADVMEVPGFGLGQDMRCAHAGGWWRVVVLAYGFDVDLPASMQLKVRVQEDADCAALALLPEATFEFFFDIVLFRSGEEEYPEEDA